MSFNPAPIYVNLSVVHWRNTHPSQVEPKDHELFTEDKHLSEYQDLSEHEDFRVKPLFFHRPSIASTCDSAQSIATLLRTRTWTMTSFVLCWLHHCSFRSEKQCGTIASLPLCNRKFDVQQAKSCRIKKRFPIGFFRKTSTGFGNPDTSIAKCLFSQRQFFSLWGLLSSGFYPFPTAEKSLLLMFTNASVKRIHFTFWLHELGFRFRKHVISVALKNNFSRIYRIRESKYRCSQKPVDVSRKNLLYRNTFLDSTCFCLKTNRRSPPYLSDPEMNCSRNTGKSELQRLELEDVNYGYEESRREKFDYGKNWRCEKKHFEMLVSRLFMGNAS